MDVTQTVTLSVIIVLTIFIVVIGIQVFFVLHDLRKTLVRVNRLLDNADNLIENVKRPVVTAEKLLSSTIAGFSIVQLLKRIGKHERR